MPARWREMAGDEEMAVEIVVEVATTLCARPLRRALKATKRRARGLTSVASTLCA